MFFALFLYPKSLSKVGQSILTVQPVYKNINSIITFCPRRYKSQKRSLEQANFNESYSKLFYRPETLQ